MKRFLNIKALMMLFVNLLFIFILAQINDFLSIYGLALIVPVIFIAAPAIYLDLKSGIIVVFISAVLTASTTPVNGFTLAAIWLFAYGIFRSQRYRFVTKDIYVTISMFQIINLLIFTLYVLFFPRGQIYFGEYFLRLFTDFIVSAFILVYISRYILSLQESLGHFLVSEFKIDEY